MDQAYRDFLEQRYRFNSWVGQNRLDRDLLVWNSQLTGREWPEWQMQDMHRLAVPVDPRMRAVTGPGEAAGVRSCTHTLWKRGDPGSPELVDVTLFECASRCEAHRFMIQMLGDFEVPGVEIREDLDIGDVVMVSSGGGTVAFARGNLVCLVRNAGRFRVPVTDLARDLDRNLASPPAEPIREAGQRIRLKASQPIKLEPAIPATRVSARSSAMQIEGLGAVVSSPAGQPSMYRFFASGGELFLQGDAPRYRPSKGGSHEVIVERTDPAGSSTGYVIGFDVEE